MSDKIEQSLATLCRIVPIAAKHYGTVRTVQPRPVNAAMLARDVHGQFIEMQTGLVDALKTLDAAGFSPPEWCYEALALREPTRIEYEGDGALSTPTFDTAALRRLRTWAQGVLLSRAWERQQTARPDDLITTGVALERFMVSRPTLDRAVKSGALADYRKPGSPSNAPRLYSEAELAARYTRS